MNSPVDLRFVGMLSSARAEHESLRRIGALDALRCDVQRWKVWMRPPAALRGGAYAVLVEAQLEGGACVATRSHGADLLATVHDAFTGMEQAICGC